MDQLSGPGARRRVAFVLNMGASGLGVARSLGDMGIPVVGMDFDFRPVGFRSKYVKGVQCPDPVNAPIELCDMLVAEGEKLEEKGVLFPCSDAFVHFVSRNRGRLARHYELTLPREEVVEGLVDKRYQHEWANRLGVPMPRTFFPRDMDELREVSGEVTFPSFLKPLRSHLWSRRFGNKGFIVRSQEELEARFSQASEAGFEVMVQKIIMPPGENIRGVGAYFGRNGYASPAFSWEKNRQDPPNFGVGSCLRSRNFPETAEMALRFAKGIGFMGSGSLEFKLDPDDGVWKLYEMNGRYWMQNRHATASGLNLPLLQYLDSQNLPLPRLSGFKEGVVWWDSLADAMTFLRLHRRGRLGLIPWVRSWFPPDVHAYFERGDVKPALERHMLGVEWAMTVGAYLKLREDPDTIWQDPVALGDRTMGNQTGP